MDLDVNQYISIFVEESREHLQIMNDVLLSLEKHPSDLGQINEIFRVAHTLKGMSATMGFHGMADLTHEMENLLEAARNEEIKITEDVIDVLFECFDSIDASVENIVKEGQEKEDNREVIDKILKLLDRDEDDFSSVDSSSIDLDEYVIEVVEKALEKKLNVFEIIIELSKDCMLKSARSFMVFNKLGNYGDVVYSNPPAEDIEDEKFERKFAVVFIGKIDKYTIKNEILGIAEIVNVDIRSIDIEKHKRALADKNKKDVVKVENNKSRPIGKIRKTVRVDIGRLDNLMNLVSELIIVKTRMEGLGEGVSEDMKEATEYLERITTSLHDAVMKVRMVPIERVFNRFPRLIRDLSRELDKDIVLEMSGEETEVDRTIIDEIGDPLIHIIRNSLDHGIEKPEKRQALGKDKTGKISLRAYPDGNNVVIEVEDDGAGIDPDVIKESSVNRGLISREESLKLSDEESLELLFHAGMSTSEEVSDVSGRGVGLDVVRTKIESLNGNIEVDTEINRGSKFIIRIPLTLAIIQALMIKLKGEIFAIPLSSVTEITTIEFKDINDIQGEEVIVYRGGTIPVIRLYEVLNLYSRKEDFRKESIMVIVHKGEKEAGIIIDELMGQQEIVIKNLGTYLTNVRYISGATILGDGSISLIIDINSLI